MDIVSRVDLLTKLRDVDKRSKKMCLACPTVITAPWFAPYDKKKGYPVRFGNKVEPLICGEKTFLDIHQTIRTARSSVHIALWSFMPGFRLVRGNANKDLDSIGELLIDAALNRNVKVRIILWGLYKSGTLMRIPALMKESEKDPYYRDDWEWYNRIQDVVNIELRYETTKSITASHHQKTVVVDNKVGYVMGMNMRTSDWDTNDNLVFNFMRDPGSTPRHDISAKVEGPCVKDLEKNFAARWARSGRQSTAWIPVFVPGINRNIPVPFRAESGVKNTSPIDKIFINDMNSLRINPIYNGIPAQIVRTRKIKKEEAILKIYRQAIANANHYIYMENQYFRHEELARDIAKRVRARKGDFDFHLVIRVPDSALERAPTTDTLKIVENAYKEFGKIFTPYCIVANTLSSTTGSLMAKYLAGTSNIHSDNIYAGVVAIWGKDSSQAKYVENIKARMTHAQRKEIYAWTKKIPNPDKVHYQAIDAHVKTLIVDDIFASIGSANLNIRSMDYDSEINIAFKDKSVVKKIRMDLWKKHLNPVYMKNYPIDSDKLIDCKPEGITNAAKVWFDTAQYNKYLYKEDEWLVGTVMPLKMLMKSKWYDRLLQIPFITNPVIDHYVDNDTSPSSSEFV
ncbi:hypothetical protein MNBD_GAMMA21-1369 [hydrothermal vent metagenome]|uniref:PLD phosphodiesterase domain-containing protein n=1 Tax=hydrothermal vent metagenome TaxID=652676 RepID=A0A3B1AE16_9ZZZZ